jgi:predicted AAA+ superfamily ATPase
LERTEDIEAHPKLGASWEGFALETLLGWRDGVPAYFWATHAGAELDLCWMSGSRRIGVELKYTSSPTVTKSMRIAMEDLKLDRLYVVHPGQGLYPLAEGIQAAGLGEMKAVLASVL